MKCEKKILVCHPAPELPDPGPVLHLQIRQRVTSSHHTARIIAPLLRMLWPLLALCLHLPELETKQKSPGVHQQDFTRAVHRYKRSVQFQLIQAELFTSEWVMLGRSGKNEYFIVVLSYFIFQTKHLLAPINTFKLLIKIVRVHTGKAIK